MDLPPKNRTYSYLIITRGGHRQPPIKSFDNLPDSAIINGIRKIADMMPIAQRALLVGEFREAERGKNKSAENKTEKSLDRVKKELHIKIREINPPTILGSTKK
jgi:hypothetical protein